jgi:hypothetical protein
LIATLAKMMAPSPKRQIVEKIVEAFPRGAAVWTVHPCFCVFNRHALRLTGFSERDFQQNKSLWLSRVNPKDLPVILEVRKRLRTERTQVSCAYRFLPNGGANEIWIRDLSIALQNADNQRGGILSAYTDVSRLLTNAPECPPISIDLSKAFETLTHDIRNCVHDIAGAFELFKITGSFPARSEAVTDSIEKVQRLLVELEECILRTKNRSPAAEEVLSLSDIAGRIQDESRHCISS